MSALPAAAEAATTGPGVDWDELGFGLQHVAPVMFVAQWSAERGWERGRLQAYGPLTLMPSAQALNYGQAIFEGMKAQRSAKDRIVLFRPDANAARFADGAERLCMPPVPPELFSSAVHAAVSSNAAWVPPLGLGALYLRPLLIGSGPILGLGPAPSYTFTVFAAAVGAYFKGGQLTPIDLLIDDTIHRSAPRGMGGTKAAGNYSPVLQQQLQAKRQGYADVVFLDAKHDTYLEEVSSCNIFALHADGRTITTPPLSGSILPGVTRDSVMHLARSRGYDVREAPVSVQEAMEASELFTTGTAVVLCSVGSLTYKGQRRQFNSAGQPGRVALELYTALTQLQTEQVEDPQGWVVPVRAEEGAFVQGGR